jgi:hypothetical protein
MPSIDVDSVLIAIRVASYGSKMDLDAKCPHCQEENSYEVDLNNVLQNTQVPDYSIPLVVQNLTIKLHPQQYFSINKTNSISFEEQRILQAINDESLNEAEKTDKYSEHMKRLVDLNLKIMIDSVESITTPDGQVVSNSTFISEFFQNADRNIVRAIRTWLEKAAADSAIKPIKVTCSECNKDFDLTVTFDYANFFA